MFIIFLLIFYYWSGNVAKRRETLKYGTFGRKNLDSAQWAEEYWIFAWRACLTFYASLSWNKPIWGNVACNKKLWNSCHKEFSLRCNLRYSTTNKIRNPIHTCVCYQYDIIRIQIVLIVTFCNLFAFPPFHDLVSFRSKLSWFRANYHLQSKYHL